MDTVDQRMTSDIQELIGDTSVSKSLGMFVFHAESSVVIAVFQVAAIFISVCLAHRPIAASVDAQCTGPDKPESWNCGAGARDNGCNFIGNFSDGVRSAGELERAIAEPSSCPSFFDASSKQWVYEPVNREDSAQQCHFNAESRRFEKEMDGSPCDIRIAESCCYFDKDLRSAATAQTGHMTPSLLIAAFVGSALAAALILVATRPVVRLQALQQAFEGE